jgi:hypothetical protein
MEPKLASSILARIDKRRSCAVVSKLFPMDFMICCVRIIAMMEPASVVANRQEFEKQE